MTNRWQNCWCILGGFLWAHGTFIGGENRRRGKQCGSKPIHAGTSVRDQAVVVLLLLSDNTIVPASFRYAWTWSLILADVSDDDVGEYTCRISSSAPNDQTLTIIKRFHLTVLSKRLNLTSICDFSSCWSKSKRRERAKRFRCKCSTTSMTDIWTHCNDFVHVIVPIAIALLKLFSSNY